MRHANIAKRRLRDAAAVIADGAGGPGVVGEPSVTGWPLTTQAARARAGLVVATGEQGPIDGGLGTRTQRCVAGGVTGGVAVGSNQPPEYSSV